MDGPDEQLDVVDGNGAHVETLGRDEVHRLGLWHRVFHCVVVRSGAPVRVLLQRRRHGARAFPGLLDISVAGHLSAGEVPLDGVREIREELGLSVDPLRLQAAGTRTIVDEANSTEGTNREIVHLYALVDDTALADLVLDPNEVAGFVEISITLLRSLLDGLVDVVDATGVTIDGTVGPVVISVADVVPDSGGYWSAVLDAAEAAQRDVSDRGV